MTKIENSMSAEKIAGIIFSEFEVNQSCTIYGWQETLPKGLITVEWLRKLDVLENWEACKDGRMRRKRKLLPNSVGGYVASKIFKYHEDMRDGKLVYQIWRFQ